jgi:hypothetical protein
LYQHGWDIGSWCLDCFFDWSMFKATLPDEPAIRGRYESAVEALCDEPLQLGPDEPGPLPHQLVLPFDDEPPAELEAMAEAYRLWVCGARWSLAMLAPSAN